MSSPLLQGRPVGLLGGSFNPAHDGHLYASEAALARGGLEFVFWLVSPGNPLKTGAPMASFDVRLDSAQRAARDPRIAVSGVERNFGTRFSIDTVKCLKRRYPKVRFVWLMGADNLFEMRRWREWRKFFAAVPVLVFTRDPWTLRALLSPASRSLSHARLRPREARSIARRRPPAWAYLAIASHPMTSTSIRATARQGA